MKQTCKSCDGTGKILRERPKGQPGGIFAKVMCPVCKGSGQVDS